ncbi:MAG: zinc-binding dehydrogenase [Chloroflexi bacterium]|nr:zinc-binding dehydrogenase [Chloroflexota bacterium]
MRAAVLDAANQHLHIEDVPVPTPRAGEILVKVGSCGVCHTDLHVVKGEVAFPTPCVLGHEIAGSVAALGPGVDGPAEGTPVACAFVMPCGTCRFCVQGRDDLCETFFGMNRLKGTLYDGETRLTRADGTPLWMYSMGGLADYAVVPATDVFPLPPGAQRHEAAILGCAVFTAYGAVRHSADLRTGESVAVVAVGGVGMNLVQVAHAFGASQIIAIDIVDDKLEMARRLGATHTVNGARDNVVATVRELTDGAGVDVAFEALGRAETFIQASEVLRDGGRMVAIGIAPGTTTAPLEITRLVRRSQRVIGSYGARTRSDMPRVLDLAARGVFRPEDVVTRRYHLEQVDEAYTALARGEIAGRAIIEM